MSSYDGNCFYCNKLQEVSFSVSDDLRDLLEILPKCQNRSAYLSIWDFPFVSFNIFVMFEDMK